MHKIKGSVSEEVWLACHSPGSRILNALERKAADLILWRLSCLIHHDGNWPQISSCYFGLFYCDYCNILCFVLTSILFCFALFFFLQNNPHTYIPLFLRRYADNMNIIPVLSYNTYSIYNKLLWKKMALLLSYKWYQYLSTVYFKLLHSTHKPNSVSNWRNK